MKSLGYSINFDELTDVVATRGNDTIYIECKRIKSSKGLESNYRKACKQTKERDLKIHFGNTTGYHGLTY